MRYVPGRPRGRRDGLVRGAALLAGGALALSAAGCGLFGGNTDQVCGDTRKAFQQYVTQIRSSSAADGKQWKVATERVAGKLDGLAAEADDDQLRKALKDEAASLRKAAVAVDGGDVSLLNTTITEAPRRIGKACG